MQCPTCGSSGYRPPGTFPSAENYVATEGKVTRDWSFVKIHEFRAPLKGEWYLSGAIPAAYCARSDLTTAYQILRKVE